MQKAYILAIGMLASLSLYSEEDKGYIAKKQQPSYAEDQAMSQNPCNALTTDEQAFAAKLNTTNSSLFCSKMTPMQRKNAMQMTNTKGPSGMKMTPDDAVQKVMSSSNTKASGSKACPVQ
jgi:hypothetical protein